MSQTTASPAKTTMLRQYDAIKAEHQDAILFFRLGDFYEMFMDDATIAARELELTLTGRGKDEARIPMCGFPYHAADNYIPKLVSRGYKVAICEQVEDPTESKGITKREVVKVVTPGTAMGQGYIDETSHQYLAAISVYNAAYGLSYLDISTGEFKLLACDSASDLQLHIDTPEVFLVFRQHFSQQELY